MSNSRLLVPIVLSIMNDYKTQASQVLAELKAVEDTLALAPHEHGASPDDVIKALKERRRLLRYDLAEKKALIEEFSSLYETRKWSCFNLRESNIVLH